MDLKTFLEAVLPSAGTYYFGASKKVGNSRLTQQRLDTLQDVQRYIEQHINADTYFATGTYTKDRKQEYAEYRKCFFLDIDAGEGKPYEKRKAAFMALVVFAEKHFLTPNIIVNSGGGIHAYWVLDKPITKAAWEPVAAALKSLCESAQLHADHAVTGDSARILRAPFTANFKSGVPEKVTILAPADGTPYSTYTLEEIRAKASPKAALSLAAALPTGDLTLPDHDIEQKPYYGKHLLKNCPMFADAAETGGKNLPEQLWYHQLHVLAFCEDGESYIHTISNKHSGYSQRETSIKYAQRVAKKGDIGPIKCETFAANSPHCKNCEFRREITTPLQLADGRNVNLPYPYDQDADGVFEWADDKDLITGAKKKYKARQFHWQIENFELAEAPGEGVIIFFDAIENNKKRRKIELNWDIMQDKRGCVTALAACGITLNDQFHSRFKDLMNAWAAKIRRSKGYHKAYSQLGWTKNPDGFALSDKVVFADGTEEQNRHSDRKLSSLYVAEGDPEPWIDISKYLTRQDNYHITTMLLSAFAAPLVALLPDHSAILSFVSARSGTGKSTSMGIAQAVWGHPQKAINQLDDTQASILKKMGYLNNIPAYWDEVRSGDDASQLMRMFFQMAGGKERSRLSASADLRETGTWTTILCLASNESMSDHAMQFSQDSEAGRVRIFEFIMPALKNTPEDAAKVQDAVIKLRENYGAVGEAYARLLVKNLPKIKLLIQGYYKQYSAEFMTESTYRFWITAMTALATAARLANKWGFTDVNLESYLPWLEARFQDQVDQTQSNYTTPEDRAARIVLQYIQEHAQNLAVYDYLPNKVNKNINIIQPPLPTQTCMGCLAEKEGRLRVPAVLFYRWMARQPDIGSYSMVLEHIEHRKTRAVYDIVNAANRHARSRTLDIMLPKRIRKVMKGD